MGIIGKVGPGLRTASRGRAQTSGFTVVAGEEMSKVNLGRSEENLEKAGQVTSNLRGEVRQQSRGCWRAGGVNARTSLERTGFLCF